ncbi:hypothetical protein BG006_007564 [Podila minutissima]|uniref:Microtubule associated protein n=1 Tax=Podila minutissima TaxID=64525 RepID=A0A9P5VKN1_9FUNG|nr:hypothetical protein BG006_007564 [Podila minutissima]
MVRQDKARLEVEIDRMLESLGTLADLLGQDEQGVEQVIQAMRGMTLWDRHAFVSSEYGLVSEHYQSKLEEIQQLHRELTHYVNVLGPSVVQMGVYPEAGYRVTVDVQQQLSDDIAKCKKEQAKRTAFVASAVVTIRHLWNELGLKARDKFDQDVISAELEQYPISDDTLQQLKSRQMKLEEERVKREALVKEHIADIIRLWDRLQIDDEEREEFITMHIGLTMDTIQSHKAELNRLEELKLTKLEEFIKDERNTLHELWDRLYYTKEQRECFEPLSDNIVTEANLTAHESEVARLKALIQDNEPLLETLAKYLQFLKDIREFVASSMDSQRLFKAEPGRLLREEKFRNSCQREFPRIKNQLESALHQYQRDNNAPFLVYGEDYLETIDDHAQRAWEKQVEETDDQDEQQNHLRNGKAPKSTPTPRTPTTKRSALFPMGRPGTPSKCSSTTPTTPTRARSVNIQSVSNPYSPSRLEQYRASSLQTQQLPGSGPKFRSESPAFGLNKLPSTPTKSNRYPGSTTADYARRSNSVISISSAMDPLEPTSPIRSRTTRLATYDLTEGMEEDEEAQPRDLRNDLRMLKRPAEEPLSEYSNGAKHKDLRRAADSIHMHRHLSSSTSSSSLERRSIVTVNSDIEEEEEEEADVTQNSVVEIDGAELYRSQSRSVKQIVELGEEMEGTIYEIDDDGWETENDDSPSKHSKTSKNKFKSTF